MSGFISWDRAALETPKKQQGIAVDKDGVEVSPDIADVSIPQERIADKSDADIQVDDGRAGNDNITPEYRDSRALPMQHSGSLPDDNSDDDDLIPPRRPGTGSEPSMSSIVAAQTGTGKKKQSGSLSGKRKAQEEKKSKKSIDDRPQTGTAQIRNFPKSLLAIARAEFPEASNNTDALAAYVLAKSGKTNLDVSDTVVELVKNWDGDKTLENMEKRLSALTTQNAVLLNMLQEMELVTTFIAFDRLGYRQDVASNIRSVDFLENGVTDLMERLREQTKILRKQEAIKNGRPIR